MDNLDIIVKRRKKKRRHEGSDRERRKSDKKEKILIEDLSCHRDGKTLQLPKTSEISMEESNQDKNDGNQGSNCPDSEQAGSSSKADADHVELEDEKIKEGAAPSTTVTVKHPLLIPEILEIIFGYLNPSCSSADEDNHESLFYCQNVCRLWNEVITKKIESTERYLVEIPSKLSSFDHRFKKIVQCIPKHRSSFSIQTLPNSFMHYFCRKIGPQMKNLHIALTYVVDKSNCQFIQFISKYCTKLDELSIDLSDCRLSVFDDENKRNSNISKLLRSQELGKTVTWRGSSSPQYYLKIRKLSTQDNRIFRNNRVLKRLPITLSPFLQTLSFTGNSEQLIFVLKTISKSAQNLEKLTHLEFYSCSTLPLEENFIQFFMKQKWNLKYFKLRFRHNVQIRNARILFHHLKESLVNLVVEFDNPDVSLEIPIEQNFLIPLSMPKLKRIEVNEQSTVSLINALHLPTLKSCVCYYSVLGKGDLFNKISLENPPRFSPQGHSLETLTIYENSIDLPVFASNNNIYNNLDSSKPNPFANLKNLHLEHATHLMLQVILANHVNIERLKLCNLYSLSGPAWDWNSNSAIDVNDRSIDWDELITGVGKPSCECWKRSKKVSSGNKQELENQPCRLRSREAQSSSKVQLPQGERPLKRIGPSITDLKKLKYLSIAFETTSCKLTDFTIYNGLMQLTDLQFLELNQQKFTSNAVAALQTKLLPFCRVILNT